MSYRSVDGSTHNTIGDARAADTKYYQQEKQNKLLQEQNQLLEQQNQENALREMLKMQHEKDIIEAQNKAQKEMQDKQLEHEEKMRILKLFDDIGLTKDAYDEYINYLFNNGLDIVKMRLESRKYEIQIQESTQELIDRLNDFLNKSDEEIRRGLKNLIPELNYENKNGVLPYEKREEFITWTKNIEKYKKELKELDVYEELKEYYNDETYFQKRKMKKWVHGIIAVVSFLWAILGIMNDDDNSMIAIIPFTVCSSFFAGYALATPRKLFKIQTKGIENLIKKLQNGNVNPKELVQREIEKAKQLVKDSAKSSKENEVSLTEYVQTYIEPRWREFIEFRKNHYDSRIEKLLVETGLKDLITAIELDYPKINSGNKIKNGTVEDYITLFDEIND